MANSEQVVENDAGSSLIEQLGRALHELEAYKDSSEDKVQWTEIEEHFRNLETVLKKKSEELEAREKEYEDKEAETRALLAEREVAVVAKELELLDRIQELKDAAVSVIGEAQANHQPSLLECIDGGDNIDRKVSSTLAEINSPEEYSPQKMGENADGVAADVKPRPELMQFCEQMDAKGLLSFAMENQKNLYAIRDELSVALEIATEPARLVLDSLEGFYPPVVTTQQMDKKDAALQGMRKSCVIFMEAMAALLARIDPGADHLLNLEIKEQAKAFADKWKPKLASAGTDATNGDPLEAEAFLQLLSSGNGNGWTRKQHKLHSLSKMATALPSTTFCQTSFTFPSQNPCKVKSPSLIFRTKSHDLIRCSAKKKISCVDQILDYIEGGPKLRKWYGAPDLLPKDGSDAEDEDEFSEEDGVRDAVLVTDGDSEIGQMIILSLIVKKARVKALVKDRRTAMEAFGTYVESMAGDASSKPFLKKALRGVRAIICPNEGFLSNVGNLQGVKHVILLSQLSVYRGSGGIQALVKNNAKKLAEQDESTLVASGIPYTIIRVGMLQNTPGGTQGFSFEKGSTEKGNLSKEDAAFICVEALAVVPQVGFTFEAVNGEEKVSDWKECLTRLMEKSEQ